MHESPGAKEKGNPLRRGDTGQNACCRPKAGGTHAGHALANFAAQKKLAGGWKDNWITCFG